MSDLQKCKHCTNDASHLSKCHGFCFDCYNCGVEELLNDITDLRDAIRLIICEDDGTPWRDVPQSEVDGYLETIRKLKGGG